MDLLEKQGIKCHNPKLWELRNSGPALKKYVYAVASENKYLITLLKSYYAVSRGVNVTEAVRAIDSKEKVENLALEYLPYLAGMDVIMTGITIKSIFVPPTTANIQQKIQTFLHELTLLSLQDENLEALENDPANPEFNNLLTDMTNIVE